MAQALPDKTVMSITPAKVTVGRQMVDMVTSGMYSDPLMVLREYMQNAVDSIDEAVNRQRLAQGKGLVEITLDGRERAISVSDNGMGVNPNSVVSVLCSFGRSTKKEARSRGFRGIGRLGGLGYCERLEFETRSTRNQRVAVVTWDGLGLGAEASAARGTKTLGEVVSKNVTVTLRKATEQDPAHFFRVTMRGVRRFHRDVLMNMEIVRAYLERVAPVPLNYEDLPMADKIDAHLAPVSGYSCYDVRLNGRKLFRPHRRVFAISASSTDEIQDVELLTFQGGDGQEIGRGWYAKTKHLASMPPRMGMRGVRVRQGNIEVGDEYFLADVFTERRFATWHIGEIHMGNSLRVNTRRDGFEQSTDYEAFLEQMHGLGQHLSGLCRRSSAQRGKIASQELKLRRVEELLGNALPVTDEHFRGICDELGKLFSSFDDSESNGHTPDFYARLRQARKTYRQLGKPHTLRNLLDGRSLRHSDQKELLEEIAKQIIAHHETGVSAEALVTRVLMPYLRPIVRSRLIVPRS